MGLVDGLPKTQGWLGDTLQRNRWSVPFAASVRNTRAPEVLADATRSAISHSSQIIEVVGGLVSAVFFALYLLVDRDRMRGGLFAVVPRHYHVRLSRVMLGLETIVGGYMRGQVLTSLLMSIFTFAVLTVAGVPAAIALAFFAGLADVLPYVGALLATGPAVIAAFAKGPTTAVVVLCVLMAYQEFESRFIVPRVYGHVLRLPATVVMIALLAGGQLLGILGALLALPIAAGLRLIVEELRFELPGETENLASRARDEHGEKEYEARAEGVPAVEAAAIAIEIAHQSVDEETTPSEIARS
jgi:predicted PurR-regulated permease PerM